MEKKELKHMRRRELLEMLLLQSKEIDRLRQIIDDMKKSAENPPEVPDVADMARLMNENTEQSKYIKILRKKVSDLQSELDKKEIQISEAGSIAEAALQINKVFEAAQNAADQYLENIRKNGDSEKKTESDLGDE